MANWNGLANMLAGSTLTTAVIKQKVLIRFLSMISGQAIPYPLKKF